MHGKLAGVARGTMDGSVHLAFSRLLDVPEYGENLSTGGDLGLQERVALRFSLPVSFRKAIFSPSK